MNIEHPTLNIEVGEEEVSGQRGRERRKSMVNGQQSSGKRKKKVNGQRSTVIGEEEEALNLKHEIRKEE